MNDQVLSRLRAAGGLIGESNLASWDELVATFQDTGVAFGIANAKREFECRSVTATQCAKALRHKLKCLEPARKKGEPLAAPTAAEDPPRHPEAPIRKSATSAQVTSTVEESAPTAAKVVQGEIETALEPRSHASKRVDYRALAEQLGRFRLTDFARAAGVRTQSAQEAAKRLVADGVIEREPPGHRKSLYRFIGRAPEPGADAGEPESAPVNADRGRVNEAPETVNAPAAAPSPEPTPASAEAAPIAAELVTAEDLRERLPRAPVATTSADDLALAITHVDLAGPFRPLLVRFLDAFAARRGFAYTLEQLGTCQDLVGVRR